MAAMAAMAAMVMALWVKFKGASNLWTWSSYRML
jgi:hypothetical protein